MSRAEPPRGASHDRIYEEAQCYDVAFGFRDVGAECDALADLFARHGEPRGRRAASVLELAAGPARHAREFARRGASASALDVSQPMCDHALRAAMREGVALDCIRADMVDFDLGRRFDLVVLLMDSASYLLDNDAVLRHLACVERHLEAGGLYVIEMSHPRDAFGIGASTSRQWSSEEDGLRVDMQWGADGDPFDPITQIDEVTVTMRWRGPLGTGERIERARQRRFTANEVDALVRASGAFEIVDRLGAIAPPLSFGNDPRAWRMVPVLRRLAGSR